MIKQLSTFALSLAIGFAVAGPALAQNKKVVIGAGVYLDVPQLSQAVDKKLFEKHGIDAEIIPFRSGRDAFEALLGGQLDFAFMAEFPVVIGAMREQQFGVLAEMSQYTATRIIHTGGAEVTSVADLAGKPIGTTTGTNVHYMLENELKAANVTAEIVGVAPPDIVPALAREDVFAAAMFPSFYGGARKTLGERYSEIKVTSYNTRFIFVGTDSIIKDDPDAVKAVLQAMYDGEKLVKADPEETHLAISRVLEGTLKPEEIAAAFAEYSHEMKLNNALIDLMVDEGKWIQARGSIKGVDSTTELMRKHFVSEPLASIDASRVNLD